MKVHLTLLGIFLFGWAGAHELESIDFREVKSLAEWDAIFEEAKTNNAEIFGKLHKEMLKRGIYLAPSPFEAGFTSLAHSDEEIDRTIEAFDQSFSVIKN